MNKQRTKKQIPDKALKLLPWYAIGKLSPQEREYLQEISSQYAEFQEILDSERKMINAIREDKSILDQSCLETTETRLQKILAQLPEENKKNKKTSIKSNQGILIFLSKLFSNYSPKIQYAVIATVTALTIALSFAFVTPLLIENNVYYPATSAIKKTNANTTTLLVGLNTEPTDPRLLRLLEKNNAKIDLIPGKSGMHHLSLSVKLNAEQTKGLLKKLTNNKELFWFAGEEF